MFSQSNSCSISSTRHRGGARNETTVFEKLFIIIIIIYYLFLYLNIIFKLY